MAYIVNGIVLERVPRCARHASGTNKDTER